VLRGKKGREKGEGKERLVFHIIPLVSPPYRTNWGGRRPSIRKGGGKEREVVLRSMRKHPRDFGGRGGGKGELKEKGKRKDKRLR